MILAFNIYTGKQQGEYKTLAEASDALNVDIGSISKCISCKLNKAGDYAFFKTTKDTSQELIDALPYFVKEWFSEPFTFGNYLKLKL